MKNQHYQKTTFLPFARMFRKMVLSGRENSSEDGLFPHYFPSLSYIQFEESPKKILILENLNDIVL